jgi:hypothetical protein
MHRPALPRTPASDRTWGRKTCGRPAGDSECVGHDFPCTTSGLGSSQRITVRNMGADECLQVGNLGGAPKRLKRLNFGPYRRQASGGGHAAGATSCSRRARCARLLPPEQRLESGQRPEKLSRCLPLLRKTCRSNACQESSQLLKRLKNTSITRTRTLECLHIPSLRSLRSLKAAD